MDISQSPSQGIPGPAVSLDKGSFNQSNPSEITAFSDKLKVLKEEVGALLKEKEAKEKMLATYNDSLQRVIDQISYKKEELETLGFSLRSAHDELVNIKADITSKLAILAGLDAQARSPRATENRQTAQIAVLQDLGDIRRMIERAGFEEAISRSKKIAYWLYKENRSLRKALDSRALDADIENRGMEDLKKQLRIKRTEIREYQQKLDQEITGRKQIEEQLWALKSSVRNSVRQAVALTFTVTSVADNELLTVAINSNTMRVSKKNDGAQALVTEYLMSNVFIRELHNNELHHLTVKRRALCVKLFFLGEITKSCSSGTRRSLKALEKDLEKEQKILSGLHRLMTLLDGATLKDAHAQLIGSEKKIKELHFEIERARKSTITEYEVSDNENVAEFNSHLFYEKTVAKGTLCDHCNEVLYGYFKQAYVCKDCTITVHKQCYVLVNVSCELNRAMAAGQNIVVQCRTIEEKEKLVKLNQLC